MRTAGPVLLVRSDSDSAATAARVVFPEYADSTLPDTLHFDVRPVRGAAAELLSRRGGFASAHVADVSAREWKGAGCIDWPLATVDFAAGSDTTARWSVGFVGGRVHTLPLQALAALSPRDSAWTAAQLARLASALPLDSSDDFRDVPFTVRAAFRFTPAPGTAAVVAVIDQMLNLEANPLASRILLVAERANGAGARYHTAYWERGTGPADSVEAIEVLAGAQLRTATAPDTFRSLLVLRRDSEEAQAYSLLVRSGPGRWRLAWTSVHTGC